MILTILVTSQNRPQKLRYFLESINKQTYVLNRLQIVFVDQGKNEDSFALLSSSIDRKYIKYHPCGLSEARNQGLLFVKGDYITFGDDDSWYDDNTLSLVFPCLENDIDGIGTCIKNENDIPYNSYPNSKKSLTYLNHFGASSASIFLKYDNAIKFDENIGVGSKFNLLSGEETDYIWKYMELHPNFKIDFHPEITVRHPVMESQNFDNYLQKCYFYARGFGYILRKHPVSFIYKLKSFLRPFCGMILYALTNRFKSEKSFYILKGRLEGYIFKKFK